jgi:serine/threonine-protein kinase
MSASVWTDPSTPEATDVQVTGGAGAHVSAGRHGGSRYVSIEELGRGGMGRVLRAYDPKLQREVAIKEVLRKVLDEDAAARLVAEARAMAKLSHPNVVEIYDVEEVETSVGRDVVLVMEYVPGPTLRAWLRQRRRTWQELLAAFQEAGRGLQAAHEAGVVHRDFKPGNVLVANDGTVKVTDFGIAEALDSSAAHVAASGPGPAEVSTAVGTPSYMAPEQHRGLELTAAVDQFAFCVALWEAMCGRRPFDGELETMARAKFAGPPKWTRADAPAVVVRAIERGLAPRPEDRWPSMAELLDALAWDPSRRTNRWLAGVGAVGALALAATVYQAGTQPCTGADEKLAGVWDDDRRAAAESALSSIDRADTQDAWSRTERALDTYAQDWVTLHTEVCEATTVRGEQPSEVLDLRMGCLHRARVELRTVVDVLEDADVTVLGRTANLVSGLRPLSSCSDVDQLRKRNVVPLPEESQPVEQAREQLARVRAELNAGRYERAEMLLDPILPDVGRLSYAPLRAEASLVHGQVLDRRGKFARAEPVLRRALAEGASQHDIEKMHTAATMLMTIVGQRLSRPDEAEAYHVVAVGLGRGDDDRESSTHSYYGILLHAQGRYEAAEAEHRAALELRQRLTQDKDSAVANSMANLASTLLQMDRTEEAMELSQRALTLRQSVFGPNHSVVAHSYETLGSAKEALGDLEGAEEAFRESLRIRKISGGEDHPWVAGARNNLGNALMSQDRYAEAEEQLQLAVDALERSLGPNSRDTAMVRQNLASCLARRGKNEQADAEYRRAIDASVAALGPSHPQVARSRHNYSNLLMELGRLEEAERQIVAAIDIRAQKFPRTSVVLGTSYFNLGEVLRLSGRSALAASEYQRARSIFEAALDEDHEYVQLVRQRLSDASDSSTNESR